MLLQNYVRSVRCKRHLLSRLLSSNSEPPVPPNSSDESSVKFVKAAEDTAPESDVPETAVIENTHHPEMEDKKQSMLTNLDSLHSLVQSHHSALRLDTTRERPIVREDFFNVKSLFTLRELFNCRVHLGHHIGCWHESNSQYLYGIRNNMHIINLASTEQHLWRALNVVSHVAYSQGSVLFVNNKPGYEQIVQEAARSCGARYNTKLTKLGYYDEPDFSWFHDNKPDLVVCSSVNNPLSQKLLLTCNKYLVPTIGILDSDVDPTNLTYVIPGNDDSTQSILLYHKLFAKAIVRAKAVRSALQNDASPSMRAR